MEEIIWHEIWPKTKPMTNEKPYFPNVITQPQEDDLKEKTKVFENSSGHNLLREDTDWAGLDLQLRMTYFLRRKKQKLCAGIVRYLKFFLYSPIFLSIFDYVNDTLQVGMSGQNIFCLLHPTCNKGQFRQVGTKLNEKY